MAALIIINGSATWSGHGVSEFVARLRCPGQAQRVQFDTFDDDGHVGW